tara:strand:+ start:265 stop:717 length:453 start_codon:yes stop_codon:yes gene_type:complete
MKRSESVIVEAAVDRSFFVLSDLKNYEDWLDFVESVEPLESVTNSVWMIVLKAQLGPFSRMKKLRMVRVESSPNTSIKFQRVEISGKDASDWVIEVTFEQVGSDSSEITFAVSYSGKLWSRALETAFDTYIEKARVDLQSYFVSLQDSGE